MNQCIKYVGLDTHKDTIAVAIADATGGKPRFYGEIVNTLTALSKLMKDVSLNGEVVSYCWVCGHKGTKLSAQWAYVVDFDMKCLRVFESPYASGLIRVARRGESPG
jgi:hypothetical protein